MNTALTVFLGIFGGGSFITFLELIFKRYDKKRNANGEIISDIKSLKSDIQDVRNDMDARFDKLERRVEDGQAIQARARLLRFFDDIQTGHKVSKDAFSHTFQDITDYTSHCDKYEDFPNGQAETAISNIKKVYEELLERERHGEDVFL